jgi:hypothetical protein
MTRRLAWTPDDWKRRAYSRLSALPTAATPTQGADLLAALSVGAEIIQLRCAAHRVGLDADLDATFDLLAQGNVALAIVRLGDLDNLLASAMPATVRACARVLAIIKIVSQHGVYFATGQAR